MKRLVILVVVALAAWGAAAETPVPLRRFAFVTGSNDGGDTLVKLKYAETDARSFAAVLEDLGGVKPRDLVLVSSPTLERFEDGLQRVRQMVASPRELDERREFLFYYSGHSDDDGLILGKDRVQWEELRRELSDIPADVKVAILDSCSSGSLTRAKGGQARPAFLFDASSDMTGHAYLTSASAEEAAQESDRIGSSFFTHYLISGLRGAADTVGDGVVTLNEAYTYAFQETLASTEKTQYGPQHPAYDINLSGSGDLVLTDLRTSSAILRVGEDVAGRLYVRDAEGNLAVELNKVGGQKTELGLEPGQYSLVLDTRTARLQGDVRVTSRQPAQVTLASLRAVPLNKATPRGVESDLSGRPRRAGSDTGAGSPDPAAAIGAAVGEIVGSAIGKAMGAISAVGGEASADSHVDISSRDSSFDRPPAPELFQLGFFADLSGGLFASRVDHVAAVNVLVGSSRSSYGFEVAGLANLESADVVGFQAAGLVNASQGSLTGYQSAGLVNYVTGRVFFFQSAGLVNVGGSLVGAQTSGLANVILGSTRGVQAAGLFNWSGDEMRGVQVAGIGNWAGGGISGAQIAGVANWGTVVKGPQISVVNIADTVSGAQVGVVNIARHVSGIQLGVVNISRDIDGLPIGVISIVQNGRHALDLWVDTDGVPYAALSLGAEHLYSVFSAGWTTGSDPVMWSLGAGLGGRANVGRAFVDFDLSMVAERQGSTGWDTSPQGSLYPRARAVLGYPLADGFALVAGVSVRALVPGLSSSMPGASSTRTIFQPSFIAGIHLG
jgi:hypothetical protein